MLPRLRCPRTVSAADDAGRPRCRWQAS